ncbi:MAG: hypothetical protein JSS68_07795 [Actinobacteria bacterium]|nr:hypothetical protein [Actinomycetota bacterium]
MISDALHAEGADLIRQAFRRAEASGREDWQTMTTAVLKNRLLDLTSRRFEEARWGVGSFRAFVDLFDDVVEMLPGPGLPAVRLIDAELSDARSCADEPGVARDLGPDRRIRDDLWTAILDYTSGATYRWNGSEAVRIPSGEEVDEAAAGPLLPTLSQDEFKEWRSKFVNEQSHADSGVATLLYGWLERGEPLAVLPTPLRIAWVVALKRRVHQRLISWFEGEHLSLPADLIVAHQEAPVAAAGSDLLRERLIAAIGRMSDAEIAQVTIPASALLRDD